MRFRSRKPVHHVHHSRHQDNLVAALHSTFARYRESRPRVKYQFVASINYSIYRVVLHVCIILLSLSWVFSKPAHLQSNSLSFRIKLANTQQER